MESINGSNKITWEIAILDILKNRGNSETDLEYIYSKIPDYIVLDGDHLKVTYGQTNFKHQVRRHLTNLVRRGEISRVNKGTYRRF